ncbi:secretin N-terminal domain-containing protein [Dechloromonas denitrificans]|uniref:secretin N-terminal domain-containing protein n=1 Tax=Dechloromonas denitrificans TaxID=281362 RepID=UPI001CF8BDB9|nr:secretin N-terminal domain-containing protein [Dechloromonas denitrificans]
MIPMRSVFLFAGVLLVCACTPSRLVQESKAHQAEGRYEEALVKLEQALRERPDDREVRVQVFRQRDIVINRLLHSAESTREKGFVSESEEIYIKVLRFDPSNARARQGLDQLALQKRAGELYADGDIFLKNGDSEAAESRFRSILAIDPKHGLAREAIRKIKTDATKSPSSSASAPSLLNKPISLAFRDANFRSVFEVLSRYAGVNFIFDKDVRPDLKITVYVRDSTIEDVLRLILTTNQLERKVLNDSSILIYPNTPAKQKDYQDLVSRVFYLTNLEAKQAQTLIKGMVKSKDVYIDDKLNLLILKDTPDAVRYAEALIAAADMGDPEVMLEVEVLEISRTRMMELGIEFPEVIRYGLMGGEAVAKLKGGGLTAFVPNPVATLNLQRHTGDTNLLANPRIRVRNKEKAKIHIGERLPVFTTTSTANVGVSAAVNYLDVGLKLEVEPLINLDDEVSMKVSLEVSSVIKEVLGPQGSTAFQVGTRTAATALRLKNGETQVLAGLISDEERNSAQKIPGLGDMPLLGRLFGSNHDEANKTEIVLLITPRIVRNINRPDPDSLTIVAGTESSVGQAPIFLRSKAQISIPTVGGGTSSGPLAQSAGMDPVIPEASRGAAKAPVGASMQPAIDGVANLNVSVTEQTKLQGDVTVQISVPTSTGGREGSVELSFDPGQLLARSPAASQPGKVQVTLSGANANTLAGTATFQVIAKAAGSSAIQIGAVRVTTQTGDLIPVASPMATAINFVE